MMQLLSHILAECKRHRVQVLLPTTSLVWDAGEPVAGLFDPHTRTITVAAGSSEWYMALAHEYGHLLQFLEGGMDVFDTYSDAYDLLPERNLVAYLTVLEIERDAEIRAQSLLSQYGAVDALEYAQLANDGLWGYITEYTSGMPTARIASEDIWTREQIREMLTQPLQLWMADVVKRGDAGDGGV